MGFPLLSVTTTSKLTRSTSIERDAGGPCGLSPVLPAGRSGSGTFAPTSFLGPCATDIPAVSAMATSNTSRRFAVIFGFSVSSLTDHTSAAQDFDLFLPGLINPDFHQRQLPGQ